METLIVSDARYLQKYYRIFSQEIKEGISKHGGSFDVRKTDMEIIVLKIMMKFIFYSKY